ncbi:MAG: MmcQ/YjbR family DNA-binding protein [Xanthomonadaceae bacterium]|nr:MmcQ/YjbR family DNA-binding protein [Xanthomonadaceae bacterium]
MNVGKVRKLVSGWPGVEEDLKWGCDIVWSVAGKMFCVLPEDQRTGACFKVPDGDFLAMTDRPGILPAPYLARAKWVLLETPKAMPEAEQRAAIRGSYELIRAKLPKKTQRELAD